MDGLDFHPYPIPQSQPFAQGYQDPNDASVVEPAPDLPGLLQRLQRLAAADDRPAGGRRAAGEPQRGGDPDRPRRAVPATRGTEVSANAAGGVIGAVRDPGLPGDLVPARCSSLVACDPNVRLVNIYHLIDEADLAGWQSGLYYVDRTAKQSAATVHDWIATHRRRLPGRAAALDARAASRPRPAAGAGAARRAGPRILVASAGRIRIFDAVTHRLRRVLAPFGAALHRADLARARRRQRRRRQRDRGRRGRRAAGRSSSS